MQCHSSPLYSLALNFSTSCWETAELKALSQSRTQNSASFFYFFYFLLIYLLLYLCSGFFFCIFFWFFVCLFSPGNCIVVTFQCINLLLRIFSFRFYPQNQLCVLFLHFSLYHYILSRGKICSYVTEYTNKFHLNNIRFKTIFMYLLWTKWNSLLYLA